MPQTKLIFVKLMLELADDTRFIQELNDSQKLDYLLCLLMAGLTHNEIPTDSTWFKSRFYLKKSEQEIKQNLEHIRKVFRKFVVYKGKYKFRKFKELHNYIYKEKENLTNVLKDIYKNSNRTPNIYYLLSSLISYYITLKRYNESDVDLEERNRYGKRLKELLVKAKGNEQLVKDCIRWVSKQGYIDWTLETCKKKWADFLVKGIKSKEVQELTQELEDFKRRKKPENY